MTRYKLIELGVSCPSCGYVISTDDLSLFPASIRPLQKRVYECPNCTAAHTFDESDVRNYLPPAARLSAA